MGGILARAALRALRWALLRRQWWAEEEVIYARPLIIGGRL